MDEVTLGVYFPLPYRVLSLAGLGILGWASNLHLSNFTGVDVVSAMELKQTDSPGRFKSLLYKPIYRIFLLYSLACSVSYLVFLSTTRGDPVLVDKHAYIPGITILILLLILISPFEILFKRERDNFLKAISRCLFSSMDSPVYFADVVFADIFTSFAKVLGDVWLSSLMLLPGNSLLLPPLEESVLRWVMPSVVSLPYLTRLRQCIVEYNSPNSTSRRPLHNALKYATAFPVIFLSAAQRIVVLDLMREKGEHISKDAWHGEHRLFRLWLLAAVVNSLYSFWWDVTHDWGLDLLKFRMHGRKERPRTVQRPLVLPRLHSETPLLVPRSPTQFSEHGDEVPPGSSLRPKPPLLQYPRRPFPYGLRPTLLYPLPIYPLLIFLNLILRLTWSIKLSSHLHLKTDDSIVIFWFEVAEVVRRWMWVFVRVEWEVIKKSREGTGRVLLPDDENSSDDVEYEMVATPGLEDLDP